jgi:hypothetical protein
MNGDRHSPKKKKNFINLKSTCTSVGDIIVIGNKIYIKIRMYIYLFYSLGKKIKQAFVLLFFCLLSEGVF